MLALTGITAHGTVSPWTLIISVIVIVGVGVAFKIYNHKH